ncbi:hypothetical protein ACHAW5_004711 [Stephanodiscus triporus]|uniref:Transcription initiation factor TFIID subunit 8 n=1 Tax=Stephanodiscus triporus TaxID=2934178 RepID=A0ABD3MEE0_9STRA
MMSAAESSFHNNVISAKASSDAPPNMNGSKVSPPPPPQPPERSGGGDGGDGNAKAAVAAASAPMTATGNEKKRHRHRHRRLRGRPRSLSEGRRSVGLSGGSPADNDASYCTEIARRSVARAALHLGMEGMEGEALDVMGSVLLGYMEMVGTTISTNVELSGRSSAHTNAYDALNAIANCTAPAAMQLGSAPSTFSSAGDQPTPPRDHGMLKEGQERGWEGLASFLFGPDWFSIPLEGEDDARGVSAKSSHASVENEGGESLQTSGKVLTPPPLKGPGGKTLMPNRPNFATNSNSAAPKVGQGKQLSNMNGTEKSVSFSLDRQHMGGDAMDTAFSSNNGGPSNDVSSSGWHAPYLDVVPPFPLVTSTENVANPHRLSGTKIPLSMHKLATEMEACRDIPSSTTLRRGGSDDPDSKLARLRDEVADKAMRAALRIPDDVYSTIGTVWGSIIKPYADSKMIPPAAAASKIKHDAASSKHHSSEPNASASVRMPPYVPNFLPPFPTDHFSNMAKDKLAKSIVTSAVMGNVLSRMKIREKRKSSDIAPSEVIKKVVSERDAVRRSVIGLGKSIGTTYWGSMQVNDDTVDDGKACVSKEGSNISNSGKVDVSVAPGEGGDSSSASKKSRFEKILPVGRASGSRLSKILEGSMNVS